MNWRWNLRLSLRTMRRNPGITAAIVLLLAFGIGANTAFFAVLDSVLLHPARGIEHPEELVQLRRTTQGRVQSNGSYPDYVDYRDRAKTLGGLIAERLVSMRLAGPPALMVPSAIVTGNYFDVLGARAVAGRLFSPDDDRSPGAHPVAVISESFWRGHFGGDPSLVGRTLLLNGYPFTVVGIAAAPFHGVAYGEPTSLWVPMMMAKYVMTRNPTYAWLTNRRAGWLTLYGRLRPGVRLETTQAELTAIAARLEALYPDSNEYRGVVLNPHPEMSPERRRSMRSLLGLIFAAVGLVLLIACGNAAGLLLARAAARTHDIGVKLALGATRRALLAESLAESLLLGIAAGALGLALAPWMLALLQRFWTAPELALARTVRLDPRVLAFAATVSLASVLLFGLAPAMQRPRPAHTRRSFGVSRLQKTWVVSQVALSVILVAGGSLVLRSLQSILTIDTGYRAAPVVMASMDLSVLGYTPETGTAFFERVLERAAAAPGVRSASLAKSSPAIDWSDRLPVFRAGDRNSVTADCNIVAPGYFRTLGIPILSGRDFTAADRSGAPRVAIISRALAEKLWGGQNPIGDQILYQEDNRGPAQTLLVIGVAADSRYRTVLDAPPALLYRPLYQTYDSISRLMVAVDGRASAFESTLLRIVQEQNVELPVRTSTMEDQIAGSLWRERAAAALLSFFGALGLALACAGIHGMVAYSAARRVREIGIRIALGAQRANVLQLVMVQAVKLTAAGILVGLPLALWAKRALAGLLYGVGALEPVMLGGVPVLFLVVALVAAFLPARRAAQTDPASALRQE